MTELERLKEANRVMREALLKYHGADLYESQRSEGETLASKTIETADRILAGSGGGNR